MAATSRSSSAMLARLAPSLRTTTLPTRAFSTSLPFRTPDDDSNAPPKVRVNPLIGNYIPAKPAKLAERDPPVSTLHPEATQMPRPSRAPTSSAEVGPNADMPPPPPPRTAPRESTGVQIPASARPHPYSSADSSRPLNIDIASIIANRSAAHGDANPAPDPMSLPRVYPKAVTGRTIFVTDRASALSATTPTGALKRLTQLVKQQKVKNKYHSQKFHERRGAKKKRLRSERWQRRFKIGFKSTVSRVLELKKQGW